jgi:hypothetical protein
MLDRYQFEITVSGVGSCESEALENALGVLSGKDTADIDAQVVRVTPILEHDDEVG